LTVHPKLLAAAIEALRLVLKFEHPADGVLSHYFRENRSLGQAERAFVAESVFGVLRHKRVLDELVHEATPRRLLLAWLIRFDGKTVRDLTPVLKDAEGGWLDALKTKPVSDLPPAVRAELPDWVWGRLAPELPESERLALGQALQEPAPLDLRVNTQRSDRETVLRGLRESGIAATPTPYSPIGVRVAGRPTLNRHPLFLEGAVEVQDEGSQLIGYLLAPRRHDLVVDFCAGAGGKSLMLGAMMSSQGRVYAFDVSPGRLSRLKPRLKRSGLSNLHPHLLRNEHDTKVKRLAGKIDRVLVDAPCSGLGTLRRNPDLKWRQSPASVAEMRARQAAILRAAASLVKPGGRLVYATCSLLREENEDITAVFEQEHPEFAPISCAEALYAYGIAANVGNSLRLWPHVHGTDGFFGAIFERRRS
jgi:16S rRNA (cytosine967-C5)-methyltransferase